MIGKTRYDQTTKDKTEVVSIVFVTGDTHGNFTRFREDFFPEQKDMTKVLWWKEEMPSDEEYKIARQNLQACG